MKKIMDWTLGEIQAECAKNDCCKTCKLNFRNDRGDWDCKIKAIVDDKVVPGSWAPISDYLWGEEGLGILRAIKKLYPEFNYLARDNNGDLWAFTHEPVKWAKSWQADSFKPDDYDVMKMPGKILPQITFADENPVEISFELDNRR